MGLKKIEYSLRYCFRLKFPIFQGDPIMVQDGITGHSSFEYKSSKNHSSIVGNVIAKNHSSIVEKRPFQRKNDQFQPSSTIANGSVLASAVHDQKGESTHSN